MRGASHTIVVCVHVFYGLGQRLFGLAGSIPPPGAAARTQVGVLFTAMMRIAESFFVTIIVRFNYMDYSASGNILFCRLIHISRTTTMI